MAVKIKSQRVDALLAQLRQITGQGVTEIVRTALEQELQRQRRLRRIERLNSALPLLQQQASEQVHSFDAASLYDEQGLPW